MRYRAVPIIARAMRRTARPASLVAPMLALLALPTPARAQTSIGDRYTLYSDTACSGRNELGLYILPKKWKKTIMK